MISSSISTYHDIEGPINASERDGSNKYRIRLGWSASLWLSLQDVKSLYAVLGDVIRKAEYAALEAAERAKFTRLAEEAGAAK